MTAAHNTAQPTRNVMIERLEFHTDLHTVSCCYSVPSAFLARVFSVMALIILWRGGRIDGLDLQRTAGAKVTEEINLKLAKRIIGRLNRASKGKFLIIAVRA